MTNNYMVTVTEFKHYPVADPVTGKITSSTRVTIKVGDFGPFTKDFPAGQDSPETIQAWKVDQARQVAVVTN